MLSEKGLVTKPSGSLGEDTDSLRTPSRSLEAIKSPIEQAFAERGRSDTRSPEAANEYLNLLREGIESIEPEASEGIFEKAHALAQVRLAETKVAELWNSLKSAAHDSCIIFLASTGEGVIARNNRQLRIQMSSNGLVGSVMVDGKRQGDVVMLKTFDGTTTQDSGIVVFLQPRRP